MNKTNKVQNNYDSTSHKKSSFATDVFTLLTGTTFTQILSILVAPILTRIYGPEDFGLSTLFFSITGIITVIVCLRYELSIMLPKSNEEAINLLSLSLLISLIMSIFTIPFVWFGGQTIENILKTSQLSTYLLLLPLFVFISGMFSALNYWNSRNKHFKTLSLAGIASSITGTGTQVGAGFTGYATGGSLICAGLVGQSVSTLILCAQSWIDYKSFFLQTISWENMKEGLIKYRKFPLIDSGSALLNTISWQLPAFILALFFSPVVVGFYSLGFRLLQLPMSFIGTSISQVFFQRASEAKSEGMLTSLVENVFLLLVTIGMFPILTLTIVGSDIFSVILGDIWNEAGVYVQILSIWTFVWFISSPLSTLYIVLEKQQLGLKFNISNFISRLLSLLLGGFLGDARIALCLYSISGIIVYGYLCLKLMLSSGVKLPDISRIIYSNLSTFLPVGLILVIFKLFDINQLFITIVSFLSCIAYYIYIIKTKPQIQALPFIQTINRKLHIFVNEEE